MIDGRALEVAWWGHAARGCPTIVLLHEGVGSVAMWKQFPALLAEHTQSRVMAYSRLGHGRSDPPATPHGIAFMHDEARMLPAILDAARLERPILFGHSDGGSIAVIHAAEHPDRVHALILEAPHVFVEDLSLSSVEQTTLRYGSTDLRDKFAKYHDNVDVAFFGWSDVWSHPEFRAWNLEEYLPRVTCPVLLIQGEQDQYGTLRQIDAIERQVSGPVERLILPDCRHSPHHDQRNAVLEAVTRFVTRWP